MKHTPRSHKGALLLAAVLLVGGAAPAWAQSQPDATPAGAHAPADPSGNGLQAPDSSAEPSAQNQRIERLSTEDAGSRVDELRVGGRSKSVTVTPKNGAPAYEIVPDDPSRGITGSDDSDNRSGRRVWRLGTF